MEKGKILLTSTVIITLIICIIISLDFQNETDKELEKRIKSAMEMAWENPDIFNQIDDHLKSKGYNIARGSSLEFTRKDGLNMLIEIPKNDEKLIESKEEIKKIVSKIIKLKDFEKFGTSVKVVVIDSNNY
ncbi:hypothetical protein M670_04112 [Schinkia azotoformans MEV2011]|uniref:Uncharacterized protein n=1 Tax=Schinkia azotoformans MEV2011 TaxID=1348973 RepID=A0A072NTZ3_SCHAZ|nr:hypothetical protein [Schinkia azotoformans]KEF36695.1 hypothetical protein M670_04112 [Schinkia azotoformans MEV2011]MEC1695402.1 hypothetical protein [Schinkia azotoformans]MEC1715080.1 hypothetical protein [Schinkia azotoformans]MEC1724410.1 hypothetical protein [Schinkia azotoformans]MEC1742662.1 hypothetical protein [Schinkia azotoformans]